MNFDGLCDNELFNFHVLYSKQWVYYVYSRNMNYLEDRLLGCGSVFKEEFIYSILEYFNLYINKILFLVSYEYMNVNNDS